MLVLVVLRIQDFLFAIDAEGVPADKVDCLLESGWGLRNYGENDGFKRVVW